MGGVWTATLAALAGTLMGWEWRSIVFHGGERPGSDAAHLAVGLGGAALVTHFAGAGAAAAWVIAFALTGTIADLARGTGARLWWALPGFAILGTALIAFVVLRAAEPHGFETVLWVALVVAAADTGGYFAGRLIGGPKLWPRVSPKKTWAGLGGAVGLAFAVGGAFSWATTGTYFYEVCTVSALAALLAQGGDLGESALKRRFGVKDAGRSIPGHGGVLDRLDGHLAATLVAAAVTVWRGKPVFVW